MLGEDTELKCKIVKKKSPTIEENKSKKEHINVVFIGHVGELCGNYAELCTYKLRVLNITQL